MCWHVGEVHRGNSVIAILMTSLVKPCNAQRSLQFKSSLTKYDSLRHTAAVDIETAGTETVDREKRLLRQQVSMALQKRLYNNLFTTC